MSRDDDLVSWICGGGCSQSGQDTLFGFIPADVETSEYVAAGADGRGRFGGKVGVSDKVPNGLGAAECENGEGPGGIGCDVASYVCEEGAICGTTYVSGRSGLIRVSCWLTFGIRRLFSRHLLRRAGNCC